MIHAQMPSMMMNEMLLEEKWPQIRHITYSSRSWILTGEQVYSQVFASFEMEHVKLTWPQLCRDYCVSRVANHM
jgi:hypothetical protein